MTDICQAYTELYRLTNERVKTAAAWKEVLPWLAGGGALAAGAGIPLAYRQGRKSSEEEASAQRPITFGAGALAGLAAPMLIKKLRESAASGLLSGPGTGGGTYNDFTGF